MGKSNWSSEDLFSLYELRYEKKKTLAETAKMLNRSQSSVRNKDKRMDWESFLKDPTSLKKKLGSSHNKPWGRDEMIRLDALLQANKSYDFIADMLKRSYTSVERQAQVTDWNTWRKIVEIEEKDETEDDGEEFVEQIIISLLNTARLDLKKLASMKEREFLEKVNLNKDKLPLSFSEFKKMAKERLKDMGYANPLNIDLGAGTYIVVGDSHGKHTSSNMFRLIDNMSKFLKAKNIIHVGHLLDDDDDISYDWGIFDNLIVLSKVEELKTVQHQRNKYNFNYQIVRDSINIGGTICTNQNLISDYTKTPIQRLDSHIFDDRVIANCHRHEFFSRCSNGGNSYVASPGCLCEKHIVRTIKQINFEEGKVVKQACWDGFQKYRRMKHMSEYWEQGMMIIHVDKKGNSTPIPCRIKKTVNGYTTAYFDKMISSNGVFDPDKKIFVNGDLHCDKHDGNVLDIQEQICKSYRPDEYVNLGDTLNYLSLNHHVMDRGGVIIGKQILDEAAATHHVLKKCSKWAKKCHIICGNHERFAVDFIEKFPQFEKYLEFTFLCNIDSLGYETIDLKNVLEIGSGKFVHGEIRMYGQSGSKHEKTAKTFGGDIFIGHIHMPGIRFGCYSIGLSGELDQGYNEAHASNWLNGFGLCNQYKGKSWMTTIPIIKNKCIIKNKKYEPKNAENWKLKEYKASLSFET